MDLVTGNNKQLKTKMNTQTKHTPGPWYVEKGWLEAGRISVTALVSKTSASVERGVVCSTDGTPFREQEEANAALIASAPSLLAELERVKAALNQIAAIAEAGVIHRSETGKPQWSAFTEIKSIIAKAKGDA